MRVVVVSGARRNVGKTQLSRALAELLPGAVRVKIGHHARKLGGDAHLYPIGTGFATIAADHRDARFLIIESNRILEQITPECTIYLAAADPKPSARLAIEKADIVHGRRISSPTVAALARRMQCDEATVRRIGELAGCPVAAPAPAIPAAAAGGVRMSFA